MFRNLCVVSVAFASLLLGLVYKVDFSVERVSTHAEALNFNVVKLSNFSDHAEHKDIARLTSIAKVLACYADVNYRFPSTGGGWVNLYGFGSDGGNFLRSVLYVCGSTSFEVNIFEDSSSDLGTMSNLNSSQIWYKSDGLEYKLIVTNSKDCKKVKKNFLILVDRERMSECPAYGFWTRGGKEW